MCFLSQPYLVLLFVYYNFFFFRETYLIKVESLNWRMHTVMTCVTFSKHTIRTNHLFDCFQYPLITFSQKNLIINIDDNHKYFVFDGIYMKSNINHRPLLMWWSLHKNKCLWSVEGKNRDSSLKEEPLYTYTLRLG